MQQDLLTGWTTFLGLLLIIVGAALIALPFLTRYLGDVEKIHPLLLIGVKLDGVYIGTSPILIIALVILFLLLRNYL